MKSCASTFLSGVAVGVGITLATIILCVTLFPA